MTSAAPRTTTITVEGGYELAEGGRWIDGRLVYVDILSGRLLELRESTDGVATPRELARLDVPLGAVAAVRGRPDTWIAAAGTGIALLTPDGRAEWLDRPEDRTSVPSRMNDGVADPAGRFWAGSMPYDGTRGAGSLYRTDPDGTVERVLDGLTTVNGPAFTADGTTLYLADSAAGTIHRWRVDPVSGDLSAHELFARFTADEGSPDGMTVDDEDCLWVAVWGGGAVRRYHSDGRLLQVLTLPAPQPTSVCLHPSDSRLLVTTAAHGLHRPTAASGAILGVAVPARAPEARPWGAEPRSA
ncbi:SMP-30/gluconolactonase/LRE family protein [Streptomyces massasporeus]